MRLKKLLSVFLLSSVCSFSVQAQDFTRLNWDVLRIDSVLPHYTEVIPLDESYQKYHYQVQICYPELERLTPTEEQKLRKITDSLPDMPEVKTYLGVSRKKGYLDLSFVPLVCRDGAFYKIKSCQIRIDKKDKPAVARVASASSRYADESVLASGRWVKITVDDDRVYMLTPSDLKKMGFDDPSKVRLFGYGGHLQNEVIDADTDYDDLQEVPLYEGKNGLLFFANGLNSWSEPSYNYNVGFNISKHTVNHYARYGCYFLTEGDAPLRMEKEAYTEEIATAPITTFLEQVLYEKDEFAWFSGGRRLFDSYNYLSGNTQTYDLNTRGAVGAEPASLRVVFSAGNTGRTTVTPEVNGTALSSFSIGGISSYTKGASTDRTFKVSNMKDGDAGTSVTLTATEGNHARLDFLELNYTRTLSIDESHLEFSSQYGAPREFQIANPSKRTLSVWRIGDSQTSFAEIPGEMKDGSYSVKVADASKRYVAVDVNATFSTPDFKGEIANQNLHAIDSLIDMVIIVPESNKLTAQAERLADAHRRLDGMKVLVVRADQIYNEFSSGTPDATAYRRFMKMLYDRAATPDEAPRYLLLFGDAAWDNRMYSSAWKNDNPEDYLLCFESEESFSDLTCYVMEDYFGLLDDGEGKSLKEDKVDLGVGRFPVTTEESARKLVDKTIQYMENSLAGAWRNSVVMLGDDGDDNLHMESAEIVAQDIEANNPEYDLRRIYWDAFPVESSATGKSYPEVTSAIERQMKEGALIMNYTGHAAAHGLSHEYVLKLDEFKNFTSLKVPLWVTAACDVLPFDTKTDNIGETAILNPNSAALAFYGTARTVYADDNLYMNRYFSKYVLARDEQGRRNRLGDAVRLSKVSLLNPNGDMGKDFTENKLHYALLGDPALLVGGAEYRVVLDSINGQYIKDAQSQFPTVSAGTLARVSGHVETWDGTSASDFEGAVNIRVYDSASKITCYNNAGSAKPFEFTTRDKVLFQGSDSIKGGQFSMTFPVPLDINYSDETGRVVFYAVSSDNKKEANGYSEHFFVGGSGTDLAADTLGPEITVALNGKENPYGAVVNTTPMFQAFLKDISGINTTGNGVGHDLELIIDDDPNTTYRLNDYYVNEFGNYYEGTVTFQIPELSSGKHVLKFRAWDVMNNSRTVEIPFEVSTKLQPQISKLYASQNPARTTTNFIFYYDRLGETCDFTIDVMDFAGRILWQHTERGVSDAGVYSVPWNLTSGGGARLGTGVYLYRVTVTSSNGVKSESKTNKIIILGNK